MYTVSVSEVFSRKPSVNVHFNKETSPKVANEWIIIFIFFWVNTKRMAFDLWNFVKANLLRKIESSSQHAHRERDFSYFRVTKSVKIHHWDTLHTLSDITPSNPELRATMTVISLRQTMNQGQHAPTWRASSIPPGNGRFIPGDGPGRPTIRSVTLPIVFNEHLNLQQGFNFRRFADQLRVERSE